MQSKQVKKGNQSEFTSIPKPNLNLWRLMWTIGDTEGRTGKMQRTGFWKVWKGRMY